MQMTVDQPGQQHVAGKVDLGPGEACLRCGRADRPVLDQNRKACRHSLCAAKHAAVPDQHARRPLTRLRGHRAYPPTSASCPSVGIVSNSSGGTTPKRVAAACFSAASCEAPQGKARMSERVAKTSGGWPRRRSSRAVYSWSRRHQHRRPVQGTSLAARGCRAGPQEPLPACAQRCQGGYLGPARIRDPALGLWATRSARRNGANVVGHFQFACRPSARDFSW